MTKLYTRTGDKGLTALADGSRIAKDDLRIEAYGTVDELNSLVGVCRQYVDKLPENKTVAATSLDQWLLWIQNTLFHAGSDLATPFASRWPKMVVIDESEVKNLERLIDFCQSQTPPLSEFVLPGGSLLNCYLHLARTVCRRAERLVVGLARNETVNPHMIPYLNRLSDFFFAFSRLAQCLSQKPEVTWVKEKWECDVR